MSYLEYFGNYLNGNHENNSEVIRGRCYSMCPDEEIRLRVKERLVHVLEDLGSTRKLVKEYSRSAADSNMVKPYSLRPFQVLKETVKYLLFEVTSRTDVPVSVVYDFVNDRLRAVRQDMTIQRLAPEDCVILLDPMVRFYVFFGYKLIDQPINTFEPVLHKKYLLECLKWLLNCCDTLDSTSDDLQCRMSAMSIKNEDKLSFDRELMESLYILCNLNDKHPLYRYLNLKDELKKHTILRTAYSLALANMRGNFVKVCRLSKRLGPLTYCAFCMYLPELQRKSLRVLSHAYNSKQLTVPSDVIRSWLNFDSDHHVIETCTHYGLNVDGNKVLFSKADFKNVNAVPFKHLGNDIVDRKIADILTENNY